MKKEQDYINDIAAIRSMMERSSKFLSLSGWAGIMAGIYALVGAYIAYAYFRFNPTEMVSHSPEAIFPEMANVLILAAIVLLLSVGTAIFLSYKRAVKRNEPVRNATSRRLMTNMALPLLSGGIFILILMAKGIIGLLAPMTLLFYGLALFGAGNYTYREVRFLGSILVVLGLAGAYLVEYGVLLWALGFGVMHIVYGLYIHIKHERQPC